MHFKRMKLNMEAATPSELTTATLSGNLDELLCIDYPGNVQNVDKAIETLGGGMNMAKSHYNSMPLGLKFRPNDIFCVPIASHKEKVTGLVMKVKRKRKKGTDAWEECETEVVGFVGSKYEFKGMADFQVLPPYTTGTSSGAYRLDVLHDGSLMDCSLPAILPPNPFSRQDQPLEYSYQAATYAKALAEPGSKKSNKAAAPLLQVDYQHSDVPSEPLVDITDEILADHLYYRQLVKLFMQCPVWTKIALESHFKVLHGAFRPALPLVAYRFSGGPWRAIYIRLGYDPRKHKEAKMYQAFELRLPKNIDLTSIPLHMKDTRKSFNSATLTHSDGQDDTICSHHYHSKMLPTKRSAYYRLCDLKNDEMQQIIHSNDGKEINCTEEDGWCNSGTYEKLKALSHEFILARAKELNIVT